MSIDPIAILSAAGAGPREAAADFLLAADHFMSRGEDHLAASALDRAYGLDPEDATCAKQRELLLNRLAVVEHGITFRYIPAGSFMMGSADGDPDERPIHVRRLDAYWIADIPTTWARYCELRGWAAPPQGFPHQTEAETWERNEQFRLANENKIRRQYCTDFTPNAKTFPEIPFDAKPMVAVARQFPLTLGKKLSTQKIHYGLPTEAEWEKAARGGLIDRRYSWGDAPPSPERCDFDHFGRFEIEDPRAFPPNGYGLHGMCGGVSEWTADVYDALAYHRAKSGDLDPAKAVEGSQFVLRGGSWSDCAAAITVSFRASGNDGETPTIGFRLVRRAAR